MVKRVKGGRSERAQALAGVPEELERWARGESAPRRQSRSRSKADAPQRRAGRASSTTASRLTDTMRNAMPESMGGVAATAAVAIGAALIEVELLPGILLGAGAILLGKALPVLGESARPMLKSAIAAGWQAYDKSRAAVASAAGQVQDVAAQVRREAAPGARAPARPTRKRTRAAGSKVARQGASAAAGALPEVAADAV